MAKTIGGTEAINAQEWTVDVADTNTLTGKHFMVKGVGTWEEMTAANAKTVLGVDALETDNTSNKNRLIAVETKNTEQDGRLTALESVEAMMLNKDFRYIGGTKTASAVYPPDFDYDGVWPDGVAGHLTITAKHYSADNKSILLDREITHTGIGKKLVLDAGVDRVVA